MRWAVPIVTGASLGLVATWALIWYGLPLLADPTIDFTTDHVSLRIKLPLPT